MTATAKKTPPKTAEALVQPSRVQQLMSLELGKSISIAERIDGDAATKEVLIATREALLNSVAASVHRAKARSGFTFTTENGNITTRSLDILSVVVITRTA